jgi:tetratricopeptide (TPR) repeat protein
LTTLARKKFSHRWPQWLLCAALAAPAAARADDYADVSQLLRTGRVAEGLAKADQYLAIKPRDPQMRFLKGVGQAQAGRATDAVATYTALTQEYPELPEPHNNLGVLYAARSDFDKARTALELAVRLQPNYAVAHENLGDVYAKLAARAYARSLQLDAGNAGLPPKLTLIQKLFAPAAKASLPDGAPVAKLQPPAPAGSATFRFCADSVPAAPC